MGRVKEKIRYMLYSALTQLSPVWSTELQYRIQNHRTLNLKEPKSFGEKLSWLKLYRYADDPLVRQCSDKLAVRQYVEACGCGDMLNELYAVYDDVSDVDWASLPKAYVLKWNFGCGFNYLHRSDAAPEPEAVRLLKRWKNEKYWNYHAEMQYKGIEPKLLCERFIDSPPGEDLIDYKFYCFSGEVKAILVIARKDGQPECACFMTPDWAYLSDIPSRYTATFHPQRPVSLEQMLRAAEKLSAPFPFVRADFYENGGKPVFGELTFTPAAGINPSETCIEGKNMGEFIRL